MHIISLSFDDGFERSNLRIAEIYERFGLSVCFNVLAFEEVDGKKVNGISMNTFNACHFHLNDLYGCEIAIKTERQL